MTEAPWYFDFEKIKASLDEHGSMAAVSRATGISATTLKDAWARGGGGALPRPKAKVAAKMVAAPVDDPERVRIDQLEAEVKHLRREGREYAKALANRGAILEQIVEAARVPVKVPAYKVAKVSKDKPTRSAVLPVFDCQFGQLVQPEDTPLGVGQFNVEVFDRRLERWLDAVTRSLRDYRASHNVAEAVLVFGGDLVEGEDIFAGQAWQLQHDPAMQVRLFVARWTEATRTLIGFLKEEIGVERIMVLGIPGNHGKVGGKRKGATPSTMSWDWLALEWMKDALRGEPVDAWGVEPGGALLFETAGHLFLTIHGDEIKGWGGLPFYGMTRYDGRAIRLTGEVYDYCLMGHHHQPASIPNGSGGEFIVSGDWVGANNLSRHLAAASRPQQRLLMVGERWGITENVPIYLDDEKRPRPHIYSTEGDA